MVLLFWCCLIRFLPRIIIASVFYKLNFIGRYLFSEWSHWTNAGLLDGLFEPSEGRGWRGRLWPGIVGRWITTYIRTGRSLVVACDPEAERLSLVRFLGRNGLCPHVNGIGGEWGRRRSRRWRRWYCTIVVVLQSNLKLTVNHHFSKSDHSDYL